MDFLVKNIVSTILAFLPTKDIFRNKRVCKRFQLVIQEIKFWKMFYNNLGMVVPIQVENFFKNQSRSRELRLIVQDSLLVSRYRRLYEAHILEPGLSDLLAEFLETGKVKLYLGELYQDVVQTMKVQNFICVIISSIFSDKDPVIV